MHKIAHMTAAILATAACSAQAADVIDLWPEGAPNKSTITAAEETNAQGSIFNVTRARLAVSKSRLRPIPTARPSSSFRVAATAICR